LSSVPGLSLQLTEPCHALPPYSDILIEAASLAYGPPEFERKARGQLSRRKLIQTAITSNPNIWGDNEDTDEVNNKRNRPPRVSSSSHSLDRKTGEIKSKL